MLWLYAHNPASQIRTVTRDNDAYAWTGHYAVTRAYTTNGLNQYTAAGSASFGYDLNGNLTSDGSRTYTYDIENRLVSMSNGAALSYDPLGRLYQVTLGASTTRFLYDGDALVAEYDGAGAITARYVHWDGADVPIISYTATGAALTSPTYLHPDHQGSIIAVSGAAGAVQINRYDEYGIPAATNVGRFQYTGQAWLPELGLYYYKARLYSPTLGRFMQTDPVGYADQFNLYAYVGNDPVNRTDPTGMVIDARRGQESAIAGHINSLTNRRYEFRDGRLRAISAGRATTGSRVAQQNYYDRRLAAAIQSDKHITISIGEAETSTDMHGITTTRSIYTTGGGDTLADPVTGNQDVIIGRLGSAGFTPQARDIQGRPLPQTPGDILMHELLVHAIPNITGVDMHNGLGNENQLRRERNMPERGPDPAHPPGS